LTVNAHHHLGSLRNIWFICVVTIMKTREKDHKRLLNLSREKSYTFQWFYSTLCPTHSLFVEVEIHRGLDHLGSCWGIFAFPSCRERSNPISFLPQPSRGFDIWMLQDALISTTAVVEAACMVSLLIFLNVVVAITSFFHAS